MSNENVETKNTSNTVAPAASITFGIISMLFAWLWYIGLPCSLLAMLTGKHSVNKYASKAGKVGFVLGIIGLIMFAIAYIGICIFVLAIKDQLF